MSDGNTGFMPRKTLSVFDVVAIIVGIVLGSGIFKLPGMVAANSANETIFLLTWVAGGIMSILGALCYAELASTYPNAGGDYYFIHRAYGRGMSFLFAWARMSVIQTGSIAFLGFFIGDYMTEVYSLGVYSPSIYAVITIVGLTVINLFGIKQGKWAQNLFTATIITGLLIVIGIGFGGSAEAAVPASGGPQTMSGLGMAMVFVLLAYGGWNESAYVSAEIKDPEKNIIRSLVIGLTVVTIVYLLVNWSYLRVLGLGGMANSRNVALDLVKNAIGPAFVPFLTFCVVFAVLSTMNATIISGARSNYALGRDFKVFSFIGKWNEEGGTPVMALVIQAVIGIALVITGNAIDVKTGFETMVAYTTPVFWFFFFLAGVSVFVLRKKDSSTPRVFSVPLYPVTPLLFCLIGIYMFWSGINYIMLLPKIGLYSGVGAAIGVVVLLAGIPLYFVNTRISK
ncbi:MAG TPA: amino acid permease [Spirochaetota bacterium]|nr:amino acid permease [Spirochaetota bacterium]HPQ53199.1 amino acid permease [Spirochaetota bacterium]